MDEVTEEAVREAVGPHDEEPTEPEVEETNGEVGSPIAELRRIRENIGNIKDVKLPIPGFGGKLIGNFRKMSYEEVEKLAERMNKSKHPQAALRSQAVFIAEACKEILIPNPRFKSEDETPDEPMYEGIVAAYPELGDEPIAFDARLCQALGFDDRIKPKMENSQIQRIAVFGCINNDMAVTPFYLELSNWMASIEGQEAEDFDLLS
jgi:hypothetical protein